MRDGGTPSRSSPTRATDCARRAGSRSPLDLPQPAWAGRGRPWRGRGRQRGAAPLGVGPPRRWRRDVRPARTVAAPHRAGRLRGRIPRGDGDRPARHAAELPPAGALGRPGPGRGGHAHRPTRRGRRTCCCAARGGGDAHVLPARPDRGRCNGAGGREGRGPGGVRPSALAAGRRTMALRPGPGAAGLRGAAAPVEGGRGGAVRAAGRGGGVPPAGRSSRGWRGRRTSCGPRGCPAPGRVVQPRRSRRGSGRSPSWRPLG